jgi:hypothetical protein
MVYFFGRRRGYGESKVEPRSWESQNLFGIASTPAIFTYRNLRRMLCQTLREVITEQVKRTDFKVGFPRI